MSEWTVERKVRELLRLPWTISTATDPDDECLVARVAEIPGVVGIGTDPESVDSDFWAAFRATLEALLESGDRVPLPPSVDCYPWDRASNRPTPVSVIQVALGDGFLSPLVRRETAGSSSLMAAR